MPTILIEPEDLHAQLANPDWAILDCRFELTRPSWGASAWAEGHIPGAQYLDLDRDLAAPRTPASGRHPLPEPAVLAATLGRLGVDATTQVIAYDQGSGVYAARLWWLLRWLGHEAVAVLNGGLAAWQRAGYPLSRASSARTPRQFRAQPRPEAVADGAEIAALSTAGALARGAALLVDARAADRFAGENETLDPVAGHVPGARSYHFARNQDASGRFRPAAELRHEWQRVLRGQPSSSVIAMCGSGVSACHNLLALELAGLPGARLYAGSWSEWIRDPAHAVARGDETG